MGPATSAEIDELVEASQWGGEAVLQRRLLVNIGIVQDTNHCSERVASGSILQSTSLDVRGSYRRGVGLGIAAAGKRQALLDTGWVDYPTIVRLCNPVHPCECSIHDNRLVSTPSIGDVILRESIDGRFLVLDAIKYTRLAGPFHLLGALAYAREHHALHIFQQAVDNRGRLLGDPARLPWS